MKMTFNMKKSTTVSLGFLTVMVVSAFSFMPFKASQQGIKRTELQRFDLSTPGKEAIQVSIDFSVGSAFGMHKHPGEELIFVTDGLLEYQVEGRPPVVLKAGQVLFIPAGTYHSARNVGETSATELATYIVEKNRTLVVHK
jgi:quercetin dioxygenase-like cupin family protein